jgi:hypothetical protein
MEEEATLCLAGESRSLFLGLGLFGQVGACKTSTKNFSLINENRKSFALLKNTFNPNEH